MSRRAIAQEAFKFALSVMLFYWLALWMDWPWSEYGGMAIILVSLSTTGASLHKGLLRIVGTTFGLAVGLFVIACFSQDRWLTAICLSAYLVVVGYFMLGSRYAYAWNVAAFVPFLIWSSAYMKTDVAFRYATFRYLETTAGIVIYTLVSLLLWRRTAGAALPGQGRLLWSQVRALFGAYRRQLVESTAPPGSELRTKVGGTLTGVLGCLEAARTDTPAVMTRRTEWRVLGIELRTLTNALELWRESSEDCRHLDMNRLIPDLEAGLEAMDRRLARIGELWETAAPGDGGADPRPEETGDTPAIRADRGAVTELSHLDRATLLTFLRQHEVLDRASEAVRGILRGLAGLDPAREDLDHLRKDDPHRPPSWDPARLIRASIPGLCFLAALLVWGVVNPPLGPNMVSFSVSISLAVALTGMNTVSVLVVLLLSIWVFLAPIYFLVMPALGTGFGLLALIFVFCFVFGYVGGRRPVLKLVPPLMLVTVAGISNRQVYSFPAFVNTSIMMTLTCVIIAVVYRLTTPSRPLKVFRIGVRGFFSGCAEIVREFAPTRSEDAPATHRRRERIFRGRVQPVPAKLKALSERLDFRQLPGSCPEGVARLVDAMQSLCFRLQSLDLAHSTLGDRHPEQSRLVTSDGERLRTHVAEAFSRFARFERVGELDGQDALARLSREFEQRLAGALDDTPRGEADDDALDGIYTVVGSTRGLLGAMATTQDAMNGIDWDPWAEERF